MIKNSIYQYQCPELAAVFERADSPKNVLIVPLDFAKDKHLCMICNGAGDRLLKAFPVHNNRAGLEHLLECIETTCKRHGISKMPSICSSPNSEIVPESVPFRPDPYSALPGSIRARELPAAPE